MATPIWDDTHKKWRLRITVDGTTKTFTSNKQGLAGKKEVLRRSREWSDNGSTDRFKARCSVVWDNFIEETSKRLGAHSGTLHQHQQLGRLYILPVIGHKRMSSLRQSDYQDIINNAKPKDGKKEVLSKKYLSNIRGTIMQFLKYGVENDYCEPLKGFLYIPQGHPTIGKEILQPEDIRKLFEPSDLHYHLALCFLVVTGLRPGECLGLKWSDIERESFTIKRAVNVYGQITDGKNKNARRTIPLSPIVRSILDQQRENTKHLHSEWIFCSPIGDIGVEETLRKQLKRIFKDKDIDITPYGLRHTFVSMVQNTMPEQMVKSLVGHSSYTSTFEIYGHRVNGELKQAAEIVDLTFKNIEEIK